MKGADMSNNNYFLHHCKDTFLGGGRPLTASSSLLSLSISSAADLSPSILLLRSCKNCTIVIILIKYAFI